MEKKQYIVPLIDVRLLNTCEIMIAGGTSPALPPGPGTEQNNSNTAPARRTEVF